MVTCRCWTCEHEFEVDATDLVTPFCDETCAQEFADIVERIAARGLPRDDVGRDMRVGLYQDGTRLAHAPLANELGLDPGSRLFREAIRMVQARRRARGTEARDFREAQYERNRPRPMRPLYPVAILLIPFSTALLMFGS
jgi:hypothetical protein